MNFKTLFLILLLSFHAYAASLSNIVLEDQFNNKVSIDENLTWIVFSDDKNLSDAVNRVFEELKIDDPKKSKGAYVADISKMPSLVTKMFALPAMREYSFKITLDKENFTSSWPRQKGKVTLMTLKNLEIVSTEYASSSEEIKKFIQDKTK